MKITPIVWVTDIERSLEFYRRLGGVPIPETRSENWADLRMGDGKLSLHRTDALPEAEPPRISLCFEVRPPLEETRDRLVEAGLELEGDIREESFGRFVGLRDPDGLWVQIDESGSGGTEG